VKAEFLSDTLDNIDNDILERTANLRTRSVSRRRTLPIWAAACVCAAVALALVIVSAVRRSERRSAMTPIDEPDATASGENAHSRTEETSVEVLYTDDPNQGVESADSEACMLPFFFYNGRRYDGYFTVTSTIKPEMLGEKLGRANGSISVWSTPDDYTDLSGSVAGDFYEISGYDPQFILAFDYGGELGFAPFICGDALAYVKGSEFFQDLLHVGIDLKGIWYESHRSWNYDMGEHYRLPIDTPQVLALIEALDEGELIPITDVLQQSGKSSMKFYNSRLYHVCLELASGLTIDLSLSDNDWVIFSGVKSYCIKVPDDIFTSLLALLDARSGEALNSPTAFELNLAECMRDPTLGIFMPSYVPRGMQQVSADIHYDDDGVANSIMLIYLADDPKDPKEPYYFINITPSEWEHGEEFKIYPENLSASALEAMTVHESLGGSESATLDTVLCLANANVNLFAINIDAAEAYAILSSVDVNAGD